ncbi:MAG: response regulator, partial [Nitrospinaceae bacterium]
MNQEKLLVVDDDGLIREMLREILESKNYIVQLAEDGEEALAKFNSTPDIQLILSDLNMPVMGGMELIARVRDSGNECPIIVLSSNAEIGIAMEAIERGANDYHVKDENIQDTITLAIEKVLEKKRIIDENRQLMADIQKMNAELETIVTNMTEIGTALSAEKNYSRLMELILTHARAITKADAGILYLLEDDTLRYKIVQNQSMGINMGGGEKPIPFPPVNLKAANALSHVALKGVMVNIPDVYETDEFDCSVPKKFDAGTGYRSKSMVVAPMKNQENDVVGV